METNANFSQRNPPKRRKSRLLPVTVLLIPTLFLLTSSLSAHDADGSRGALVNGNSAYNIPVMADIQDEYALMNEAVSLTRQAVERRAELEKLRLEDALGNDAWAQLEAIAGMNRVIMEINASTDETVSRMADEVNVAVAGSPEGMEWRWSAAYTVLRGMEIKGMNPATRDKTRDITSRFRWNATSDAAGYEIRISGKQRGLEGVESYKNTTKISSPSVALTHNKTHDWQVRAVDRDGQNSTWSTVSNLLVSNHSASIYTVGDRGPAGGIIFYDKGSYSDDWRYLEFAPRDQGSHIEWGGYRTAIGGTATSIGTGKANTEKIVRKLGSGNYAARICYDLVLGGYDDWFLPSKDELNELYRREKTDGDFMFFYYWSSTESNSDIAWSQSFGSSYRNYVSKSIGAYVRAVRAF